MFYDVMSRAIKLYTDLEKYLKILENNLYFFVNFASNLYCQLDIVSGFNQPEVVIVRWYMIKLFSFRWTQMLGYGSMCFLNTCHPYGILSHMSTAWINLNCNEYSFNHYCLNLSFSASPIPQPRPIALFTTNSIQELW